MAGRSIVLKVMSGPDDGRKIYLVERHGDGYVGPDGTWTIVLGRREECDISIPFDTQVSRQHALLRLTPEGEFWLSDAGSMNGTFLEKMQIDKPTVLNCGQLFRVGRTWLRIDEQPEMDKP
jgi:pSer/pThr/pTyr-binding forkhead associated (FHA) protein